MRPRSGGRQPLSAVDYLTQRHIVATQKGSVTMSTTPMAAPAIHSSRNHTRSVLSTPILSRQSIRWDAGVVHISCAGRVFEARARVLHATSTSSNAIVSILHCVQIQCLT
jgi:hypothetical protein